MGKACATACVMAPASGKQAEREEKKFLKRLKDLKETLKETLKELLKEMPKVEDLSLRQISDELLPIKAAEIQKVAAETLSRGERALHITKELHSHE